MLWLALADFDNSTVSNEEVGSTLSWMPGRCRAREFATRLGGYSVRGQLRRDDEHNRPGIVIFPSEAARLRRAAAVCSKRYDPLFRHEVAGADGLGSPSYQTGTSEAQPDEHGPATSPEVLGSWETAKFHTVRP